MSPDPSPKSRRETASILSPRRKARADQRYAHAHHVQYVHPKKPGKVTLDMGADPIPTGTLRSIYNQAGWEW